MDRTKPPRVYHQLISSIATFLLLIASFLTSSPALAKGETQISQDVRESMAKTDPDAAICVAAACEIMDAAKRQSALDACVSEHNTRVVNSAKPGYVGDHRVRPIPAGISLRADQLTCKTLVGEQGEEDIAEEHDRKYYAPKARKWAKMGIDRANTRLARAKSDNKPAEAKGDPLAPLPTDGKKAKADEKKPADKKAEEKTADAKDAVKDGKKAAGESPSPSLFSAATSERTSGPHFVKVGETADTLRLRVLEGATHDELLKSKWVTKDGWDAAAANVLANNPGHFPCFFDQKAHKVGCEENRLKGKMAEAKAAYDQYVKDRTADGTLYVAYVADKVIELKKSATSQNGTPAADPSKKVAASGGEAKKGQGDKVADGKGAQGPPDAGAPAQPSQPIALASADAGTAKQEDAGDDASAVVDATATVDASTESPDGGATL